jgi:hypothetical protein
MTPRSFTSIPAEVRNRAAAVWVKLAKEGHYKPDEQKRFWSIAAEVLIGPDKWKAEIAEVFAVDGPTALATYFMGQQHQVRIVGVAPTLGFFVNDKDGNELSTT